MAAHPDVKIDLRLHDGFIDLVEQEIGVSVRIGDLPDNGLIVRRIGTTHRMLLAHQDYLRLLSKGVRAPVNPEDISTHEYIVYTGMPNSNLWIFTAGAGASEAKGSTKSIRVEGHMQTNSGEVQRSAVSAGMGIGYAPTWLFNVELASGRVVRLMPNWELPQSPIQLVISPERKNFAKVRVLVEHISAALT